MKFCAYCGKQLADKEVCNCEEAKQARVNEPAPASNSKKTAKKPILFAAIIAVVVIVALVLFIRPEKADPTEYLDISFSGLSGQGKCDVDLDKGKMIDTILDVDADSIDSLEEMGKYMEQLQVLEEEITVSTSKENGFSNGDTVNVTVSCTGEAARHFKTVTVSKTVEGLTEATFVDPFEDIEISYSGINGSAEAVFKNNKTDGAMELVTFIADPQYNLSTGDAVTITAKLPEDTSQKTGYILSETTKIVTVPELGKYMTEPSQISETLIQEILDVYIPKYTWGTVNNRIYETPQYYGSYFAVYKDKNPFFFPLNELVVWIYFENKLEDGSQMPTEYVSITYQNIVVNPDGTLNIKVEDGYDDDPVWPVDIEYEIYNMKDAATSFYELEF